jgi:hypothetical protein
LGGRLRLVGETAKYYAERLRDELNRRHLPLHLSIGAIRLSWTSHAYFPASLGSALVPLGRPRMGSSGFGCGLEKIEFFLIC